MKKITILYGSDTGNTKSVAEKIAQEISDKNPEIINVADATAADIEKADVLLLGTPTWGYGDMQDDWDAFLPTLQQCNLSDKTIALFGLGDSDSYPDTFVNAMGTIYQAIQKSPCNIIGKVPTEGYNFEDSAAVEDDNFVGLVINEDSEPELTNERIHNWISSIKNNL